MANKRQLKKQIRMVCGDLAGECALAAELIPGADRKEFNRLIGEIARLQTLALARISFVFDKDVRSFESAAEYKKAKEQFFATAMDKLIKDFTEQVNGIIKQMNSLLTKGQRDLQKSMS